MVASHFLLRLLQGGLVVSLVVVAAACSIDSDDDRFDPSDVTIDEDSEDDPTEDPVDDPLDDPAEDPVDDPIDDPAEDPVDDPLDDIVLPDGFDIDSAEGCETVCDCSDKVNFYCARPPGLCLPISLAQQRQYCCDDPATCTTGQTCETQEGVFDVCP